VTHLCDLTGADAITAVLNADASVSEVAADCLDLETRCGRAMTVDAARSREGVDVVINLITGIAGEVRFVVPTVASSVDLVVHLGIGPDGVRRVEEVVAVPGRVENDVIETRADLRAAARPPRATRRMPPRPERLPADSRTTTVRNLRRPTSEYGIGPGQATFAVTVQHRPTTLATYRFNVQPCH
jgi:hypothetical protein